MMPQPGPVAAGDLPGCILVLATVHRASTQEPCLDEPMVWVLETQGPGNGEVASRTIRAGTPYFRPGPWCALLARQEWERGCSVCELRTEPAPLAPGFRLPCQEPLTSFLDASRCEKSPRGVPRGEPFMEDSPGGGIVGGARNPWSGLRDRTNVRLWRCLVPIGSVTLTFL